MALKRQDWPGRGEFNSPQEMRRRVAFLACLAAFAGGVVAALAGLVAQRYLLLLAGLAALGASWLLRDWLQRRGQWDAAEQALDEVRQPRGAGDTTRVAQLMDLLREWEAMEQRRGTAKFDPWALQAVRNEIAALVEQDAALATLFHAQRHAA
jgi:hypothetical protein